MRKAFATAAILINSAFALTIKQDSMTTAQRMPSAPLYPTDLAEIMGEAERDKIIDGSIWRRGKEIWKEAKEEYEEEERQREKDGCDPDDSDCCDDSDCDDDKCDPDDSDCCDDSDCDDDKCDPDDSDCDGGEDEPSCKNELHTPQSEAEYTGLLNDAGSKPVLVKLGTDGCGACKHIAPYFKELAEETDCRKMMFVDGDLNKIGKAWYGYKLQYIPTFIVFLDNVEQARYVGTDKNKIQALVDDYGLSEDEYCDGDGCDPDDSDCDDGQPDCKNELHTPQSQGEYEDLLDTDKPVIVKLGTEGCGACRHIAPFFKELAEETDCNQMMFVDGDLNKIGKAWYPYKLQYIPTFIVFLDNKEQARYVGTDENKIRALVNAKY